MASAFGGRSVLSPTLWLLARRHAMGWLVGGDRHGACTSHRPPRILEKVRCAHHAGTGEGTDYCRHGRGSAGPVACHIHWPLVFSDLHRGRTLLVPRHATLGPISGFAR